MSATITDIGGHGRGARRTAALISRRPGHLSAPISARRAAWRGRRTRLVAGRAPQARGAAPGAYDQLREPRLAVPATFAGASRRGEKSSQPSRSRPPRAPAGLLAGNLSLLGSDVTRGVASVRLCGGPMRVARRLRHRRLLDVDAPIRPTPPRAHAHEPRPHLVIAVVRTAHSDPAPAPGAAPPRAFPAHARAADALASQRSRTSQPMPDACTRRVSAPSARAFHLHRQPRFPLMPPPRPLRLRLRRARPLRTRTRPRAASPSPSRFASLHPPPARRAARPADSPSPGSRAQAATGLTCDQGPQTHSSPHSPTPARAREIHRRGASSGEPPPPPPAFLPVRAHAVPGRTR
ncbi:hypothetical protein WOLCODRAFT_166492 [Wolfiporia cocos MD-104 SS10]|uniref:Uncharacterized protein n=1 Tax=Wolfiporia cocos (strain MD-104) TaxID=742152 RepID=A0A2H3J0T3_WOLCO|nr:hypothetical protein WOLCODRAFT_166492 [Wolfiporia cocos MD-104 SS10]